MKTEFIENDSPATKPKRAFFTDDDKKFLLNYFQKNPYPNDREKSYLSKKLRKPVAKITNWYKNERARQGRTCQKKILRKQRELSEISDYEETDYEPIPKRRKLRIPYKYRLKSETDSSESSMEELPDEDGSDSPTSSILDDTPITQLLSVASNVSSTKSARNSRRSSRNGSLPSLEPLPIEGLLAIEGNSTKRMRKMPKLRKMPIQASTEILAITENRNYHPTKDMPTLTRRPDSAQSAASLGPLIIDENSPRSNFSNSGEMPSLRKIPTPDLHELKDSLKSNESDEIIDVVTLFESQKSNTGIKPEVIPSTPAEPELGDISLLIPDRISPVRPRKSPTLNDTVETADSSILQRNLSDVGCGENETQEPPQLLSATLNSEIIDLTVPQTPLNQIPIPSRPQTAFNPLQYFQTSRVSEFIPATGNYPVIEVRHMIDLPTLGFPPGFFGQPGFFHHNQLPTVSGPPPGFPPLPLHLQNNFRF